MIILARSKFNDARIILNLTLESEFQRLVEVSTKEEIDALKKLVDAIDVQGVKSWYQKHPQRNLSAATWKELITTARRLNIPYYSRYTREELISLIEEASNARKTKTMESDVGQGRHPTTGVQ
jgi:hypothetical protein